MKALFSNVRNILWLYRPYLKYGKLFVLFSLFFWLILVPLSNLINVYLPNAIIGALGGGRPFPEIVAFVIALQLVLMAQPVYENVFNMFCKNRALARIELRIKRDVYEKAIHTDYRYIDDPQYYDRYSWAVNEYANKAADAQKLVNRFSSSLITVVSMLAIIGALSPIAIAVTVASGIVENIMYILTNYFDVKKDAEIVPHDRRLAYYHRVFYQSDFAADLKSTNLKKYIHEKFDRAGRDKLGVIQRYASKTIGWSLMGSLTFYIARTYIILNIAHGIYTGDIPGVGAYVTMMLAVDRLTDTMNGLFYYVKDGNRLGLYAKKIRAFFDDVESKIETGAGGKAPPAGNYAVEFKDVRFRYENSEFAISDFNLRIAPGEKVAIVGENGAGKSTLVKLLLRLYDVSGGRIEIDGTDIREYDRNALRLKIGVAFQNSNVYAIPFAENIGLYREADAEKLDAIARKLGLDRILAKNGADFSAELTREFDENGIMLSGGEIQKIGIARLLTGEFGLLLLDEPSSALDPIAEYEMTKLILDSGNRSTTIMVAHRLSTIRNADRIILVEGGRIKEMGTHGELIALNGKYCEMFTKQAENYIA